MMKDPRMAGSVKPNQGKYYTGGPEVSKFAEGGAVMKKKPAVAMILAKMTKKPMESPEEGESMEHEAMESPEEETAEHSIEGAQMAAGQEMMDAFKAGDVDQLVLALRNFHASMK